MKKLLVVTLYFLTIIGCSCVVENMDMKKELNSLDTEERIDRTGSDELEISDSNILSMVHIQPPRGVVESEKDFLVLCTETDTVYKKHRNSEGNVEYETVLDREGYICNRREYIKFLNEPSDEIIKLNKT